MTVTPSAVTQATLGNVEGCSHHVFRHNIQDDVHDGIQDKVSKAVMDAAAANSHKWTLRDDERAVIKNVLYVRYGVRRIVSWTDAGAVFALDASVKLTVNGRNVSYVPTDAQRNAVIPTVFNPDTDPTKLRLVEVRMSEAVLAIGSWATGQLNVARVEGAVSVLDATLNYTVTISLPRISILGDGLIHVDVEYGDTWVNCTNPNTGVQYVFLNAQFSNASGTGVVTYVNDSFVLNVTAIDTSRVAIVVSQPSVAFMGVDNERRLLEQSLPLLLPFLNENLKRLAIPMPEEYAVFVPNPVVSYGRDPASPVGYVQAAAYCSTTADATRWPPCFAAPLESRHDLSVLAGQGGGWRIITLPNCQAGAAPRGYIDGTSAEAAVHCPNVLSPVDLVPMSVAPPPMQRGWCRVTLPGMVLVGPVGVPLYSKPMPWFRYTIISCAGGVARYTLTGFDPVAAPAQCNWQPTPPPTPTPTPTPTPAPTTTPAPPPLAPGVVVTLFFGPHCDYDASPRTWAVYAPDTRGLCYSTPSVAGYYDRGTGAVGAFCGDLNCTDCVVESASVALGVCHHISANASYIVTNGACGFTTGTPSSFLVTTYARTADQCSLNTSEAVAVSDMVQLGVCTNGTVSDVGGRSWSMLLAGGDNATFAYRLLTDCDDDTCTDCGTVIDVRLGECTAKNEREYVIVTTANALPACVAARGSPLPVVAVVVPVAAVLLVLLLLMAWRCVPVARWRALRAKCHNAAVTVRQGKWCACVRVCAPDPDCASGARGHQRAVAAQHCHHAGAAGSMHVMRGAGVAVQVPQRVCHLLQCANRGVGHR